MGTLPNQQPPMTLLHITKKLIKGLDMTGEALVTLTLAGAGLPPILSEILKTGSISAFERLRNERLEKAHQILLNQITRGKIWKLTDDENASAIFAYFRASHDGAAQVNLEAMAEAIVTENQEPALTTHTRRRHLMNLASLSHEEVLVLAAFIKEKMLFDVQPKSDEAKFFPWPAVLEKLTAHKTVFQDNEDVIDVCSGLQRTGYLRPANVYSGTAFAMTNQLTQLSLMVDLDAALSRAAANK